MPDWAWTVLFFTLIFGGFEYLGNFVEAVTYRIRNGGQKRPKRTKGKKAAIEHTCTCSHPVSSHDLDEKTMIYGGCHEKKLTRVDEMGTKKMLECACLRYTGPTPPEDWPRMLNA